MKTIKNITVASFLAFTLGIITLTTGCASGHSKSAPAPAVASVGVYLTNAVVPTLAPTNTPAMPERIPTAVNKATAFVPISGTASVTAQLGTTNTVIATNITTNITTNTMSIQSTSSNAFVLPNSGKAIGYKVILGAMVPASLPAAEQQGIREDLMFYADELIAIVNSNAGLDFINQSPAYPNARQLFFEKTARIFEEYSKVHGIVGVTLDEAKFKTFAVPKNLGVQTTPQ